MPSVDVLIWFDVEDLVTVESDHALAGLIRAMDACGVQATFKLVGEKVRLLRERGREDIIEGLSRHDIGYHTDFHSVHPTVAEYLEGLGWNEGRAEFERRERSGMEELERVFGRTPSCYGQPGASWAPQVYPVLGEWGIPVYLDEANHVGLSERPFFYCGILNVLRLRSNATRFDLNRGRDGLEEGKEAFDQVHDRLSPEGGTVSIWYHPCEYATYEFWDGVNLAGGENPPQSSWKSPRVKPQEVMERELGYFEEYVRHIASRPHVSLITAAEAAEIYRDRVRGRELSAREILRVARSLGSGLSFCEVDGGSVSPAEALYLVSRLLSEALRTGDPEAVERIAVSLPGITEGPTLRTESTRSTLDRASLIQASDRALQELAESGRVPHSLPAGGGELSPSDFLATASALLVDLSEGRAQKSIPVLRGSLDLEREVREEGSWGWSIFPEGFSAPGLMELARLQTWTMKPARALQ